MYKWSGSCWANDGRGPQKSEVHFTDEVGVDDLADRWYTFVREVEAANRDRQKKALTDQLKALEADQLATAQAATVRPALEVAKETAAALPAPRTLR